MGFPVKHDMLRLLILAVQVVEVSLSMTCYAHGVHSSKWLQVRSMKDNVGDKEEASASTAVQMSGLHAVPVAGDDFTVATSLDEVRC